MKGSLDCELDFSSDGTLLDVDLFLVSEEDMDTGEDLDRLVELHSEVDGD